MADASHNAEERHLSRNDMNEAPRSRLRIAHVLLTARFAGSERQAVELANRQVERHAVAMVLSERAAEDRPDAWAHRLDPRVEQVRLGRWRPLWPWQVRNVLQRWRPDVAHAHLSAGCRALRAWRHSALRVATLHIHYKPQQHEGLDALIAIAPWQLEAIPAPIHEHCVVIPNASNPVPPAPGARARLRASLGITEADFLVGTLGRAEHSKGWDLLLQAWIDLAPSGARLVLVGNGPAWSNLRRQAPPDVAMPGFTEHPQDWLAAIDLFVSAARSEPFGLVFLEAMHAHLPVLATATEGARYLGADFIGQPETDSVSALRNALKSVLALRPPRRKYNMLAFRPELQAHRVESFYLKEMSYRAET